MATNQTTVTVSLDTTYALPLSYSSLTMVDGVDHQEQLLIFRNDIEEIYGSPLSLREYRGLGQISSSWLTLDDTNREITAVTIPVSATFTMDDASVVAFPPMEANEDITILRLNVLSQPYVTWTTGARITADQLNLTTNHLLGLIQEVTDKANRAILREDADVFLNPVSDDLDMDSHKITNLGLATDDGDAASKAYVTAAIAALMGAANGIATLGSDGKLTSSQAPGSLGATPGVFFSQATKPTRTTAADGLFAWGSQWYNTTNGRLYVYISDDRYSTNPATNGEIGYWVDVSAPL